MRRRSWITSVGVAAVAVAGSLAASQVSGEEPPDEVLDGEEVRDLLAILESQAFRDPEYCDLRLAALKHLVREVEAGGAALRDLRAWAMGYELHRWNGTEFVPLGSAWIAQGA